MVMQKLIRAGKVARRVEDPEARAAAEGAAGGCGRGMVPSLV